MRSQHSIPSGKYRSGLASNQEKLTSPRRRLRKLEYWLKMKTTNTRNW